MLDLGWSEMAIIAVVALFVIGPKDLPKALRTLGHYGGKVRGLAREFRGSVDEAVKEAELEEVKNQIQSVTNMDLDSALDATERLAEKGDDPDSNGPSESADARENTSTATAGKHFARFGEHYTKTDETETIASSDNSEQEETRDKEDAASPTPNLPTGVAQVVEARERDRERVDTVDEKVDQTESKPPAHQTET